MDGIEGLIEQVPGAAAVILAIFLFLKDKSKLQDLHYKTIDTLFKESDTTNKELLIALKESTLAIGRSQSVNEQALKAFERVVQNLQANKM